MFLRTDKTERVLVQRMKKANIYYEVGHFFGSVIGIILVSPFMAVMFVLMFLKRR